MTYILLTGATGMLGSVILKQLIAAGYNVNAVIRSFGKSRTVIAEKYENAVKSGQLTFTEIPDMGVPGVFDEPAKGASQIIHAATPLGYENFMETIIKPASAVNENVLRAASASPNLKRLIITGSIVATTRLPEGFFSGKTISEKDYNDYTVEDAMKTVYNAYSYSKVTSEKEAWAFMEKNKPGFDLIFLLAPSIIGKSIQPGWKPSKTNLGGVPGLYREVFDKEKPGWLFPYYMDVEDVAAIHLKALDQTVPGNNRYLFHAQGLLLGDRVANFIREKFPQLKDRIPEGTENPVAPPNLMKTDISKSEAVFGSQWRGWESSVTDMVNDILRAD